MRTSFDPEADTCYARFAPVDVAIERTEEVAPGVMLDLDASGQLVGVEVLSVSLRDPEPAPEVTVPPETITPGRGSPESAAWFRDKLARLSMTRGTLARFMLEQGDDRQRATILRT